MQTNIQKLIQAGASELMHEILVKTPSGTVHFCVPHKSIFGKVSRACSSTDDSCTRISDSTIVFQTSTSFCNSEACKNRMKDAVPRLLAQVAEANAAAMASVNVEEEVDAHAHTTPWLEESQSSGPLVISARPAARSAVTRPMSVHQQEPDMMSAAPRAKAVTPVKSATPVTPVRRETIALIAQRTQQSAEQHEMEAKFDGGCAAHTELLERANKFRGDHLVQIQRTAFVSGHTTFAHFQSKIHAMEVAQYEKEQREESESKRIVEAAAAVRDQTLVRAETTFGKTLDANAWQRFLMSIYSGVPAMFALVCIAFALIMFVLLAAGMLSVDFGAAPMWMKMPVKIVYCPLKAIFHAATGSNVTC